MQRQRSQAERDMVVLHSRDTPCVIGSPHQAAWLASKIDESQVESRCFLIKCRMRAEAACGAVMHLLREWKKDNKSLANQKMACSENDEKQKEVVAEKM